MKKCTKTNCFVKRAKGQAAAKLKRVLSVAMVAVMMLFVLPVTAFALQYDLAAGSVSVTANDQGQFVTQVNGVTGQADNAPVITQNNPATATSNTISIVAGAGKTASVAINGVNINASGAAVETSGAGNVKLELDGTSSVTSGNNHAGVEKNNTGSLTITDVNNNGSLTANGGYYAAGIGSGNRANASDITISGGNITANGGERGAGIGSGMDGNANNITISGGTVTANGGDSGAGIGCGESSTDSNNVPLFGSASSITIEGGTVTASGGIYSAGIGGGSCGSGSDITISGGTVTATGGGSGAGIGSGTFGSGSDISVSGPAQVKVQGGASTYMMGQEIFGQGSGIGSGGSGVGPSVSALQPVNGVETTPDTSGLQSNGRIDYYVPGADMNSAAPTATIVGIAPPPGGNVNTAATEHSCAYIIVTIGEGAEKTSYAICPVCGTWGGKRAEAIANAQITEADRNALPDGAAVFFGMEAPFDGVLYAFTAAYAQGGKAEPFKGKVSVTRPLDAERYGEFKLVRVDVTEAAQAAERQETWTELEYTLKDGKLSFETDREGLFLLLPR